MDWAKALMCPVTIEGNIPLLTVFTWVCELIPSDLLSASPTPSSNLGPMEGPCGKTAKNQQTKICFGNVRPQHDLVAWHFWASLQ